tara:strand:- start:27429 stop:29579 length:2151 start_codon:yes stop_codon:yes gene_type:complete
MGAKDEPQRDTLGSLGDMGIGEGVTDIVSAEDNPEDNVDSWWLSLARSSFRDSSTWLDASVRKQWEKNLAHFNGRFAPGSKYESPAYRKRSRVFRPKTRSAVRQNEAAVAAAMFATDDLVSITPLNDSRQESRASAAIMHSLLEYRLQNSIPWFLTTMGAFQDTMNYGVCVSHQYWEYMERETKSYQYGPDGQPVMDEQGQPVFTTTRELVTDKPCIDLMPPENLRIDPSADWRDPVNSSPYVIRMVPMYVGDALERMEIDMPGQLKWRKYSQAEIIATRSEQYDSTRSAREPDRADSVEAEDGYFATVWAHENFVRINGEEYVFWTMGTSLLLSDAVPLSEAYFHNKRPIVMGYSNLESHKTYPSAHTQLIEGLQEATNDIQNQRSDNVQLVLNKRYLLKRGQQIDTGALMRNVPGGAVVTQDPDKDIRVLETNDVTASSYNEQDRIDVQLDEMMGAFSQSSVSNNRSLNETVGGMNLLNSSANAVTEYSIRVWVETWVEPVLRQLMLLEQHYENDTTILSLAAEGAKLERFGLDEVTDQLLMRELTLSVNVGIGATNPQQKVERMVYGLNSIAGLPGGLDDLNVKEVRTEVFGALGYKNGARFFTPAEGEEQPEPPPSPEMLDFELRKEEMQRKFELEDRKLQQDYELRMADIAARENMTLAQLQAKLQMDRDKDERRTALELQKDKTKRETVALTERNRSNEMILKRDVGSGI